MHTSLFRYSALLFLGFGLAQCSGPSTAKADAKVDQSLSTNTDAVSNKPLKMSIYDQGFQINTLTGQPFDFASLKGKRLLLVNTASECGFTPQYKQLQELHETYGGKGFEIVGFPANNFGGQEPGSNAEIASFCEKNYGVTFAMTEKISVKGQDIHPIYKWLTDKDLNGVKDMGVQWNFQKYLIDEEGHLVDAYLSNKSPLSEDIIAFASGKRD